jgi:hypothetical protein
MHPYLPEVNMQSTGFATQPSTARIKQLGQESTSCGRFMEKPEQLPQAIKASLIHRPNKMPSSAVQHTIYFNFKKNMTSYLHASVDSRPAACSSSMHAGLCCIA